MEKPIHCDRNPELDAPAGQCDCYPCRIARRGIKDILDIEDIDDLRRHQAAAE